MIAQSYPFLSAYPADAGMIKAAQESCEENGVRHLVGRIATGDLFIGDSETKRRIEAACHPACVEMEGAAVAQGRSKERHPLCHSADDERQLRRGGQRETGRAAV